jgi:hypothetical protein
MLKRKQVAELLGKSLGWVDRYAQPGGKLEPYGTDANGEREWLPEQLWEYSEQAREALQELLRACTRNEDGRHFTQFMAHWHTLERAGLIAIHRPKHHATGTLYDAPYWELHLTPLGNAVAQRLTELLEDGHLQA